MLDTPLAALDSLDDTAARRLLGPVDRMPARYRGPHRLSHRGWLNFAERLERSEETAAVVTALTGSRQVLDVGGGPDNELVSLLNETCVPLADEPHDHQGFLLATAARALAEAGLSRLTLWRTEAALQFPESSQDERVAAAAAVLVDLWYDGHPRTTEMYVALRPVLRRHFDQRPHAIGDQGVVLIARPEARS